MCKDGHGQDHTHKEVNMKQKNKFRALIALVALALVCTAFTGIRASAADADPTEVNGNYSAIKWSYDANTDSIIIQPKSGTVPTKVGSGDDEKDNNVYLMFSSGKEITSWVTKNQYKLDIADINDTNAADEDNPDTTVGQYVVLTSESLKIKVSADSYFIITNTAAPVSGEHTFKINKSEWKKPTVVIDYAAAYAGNDNIAIASVTYKSASGSSQITEVSGSTEELLEGDGNTNKKAFASLEWSKDKNTWYNVYDEDNGFTGDALYQLVSAATKQTIYFRQGGVSSNTTEGSYRPSDATKVSLKQAAKAPTVKLDVKKVASIAVKQKFDYQVLSATITPTPTAEPTATPTAEPTSAPKSGFTYEVGTPAGLGDDVTPTPEPTATPVPTATPIPTPEADPEKWITVLPYNKNGSATSPYMVTTKFKAVKIGKDSAESITMYYTDDESVKKNLPLSKLLEWTTTTWTGDNSDDAKKDCRYGEKLDYITLAADMHYTVFVRKSATSGKPASAYSYIEFSGSATEPKLELKTNNAAYLSFVTAASTTYQYAVVDAADLSYTDSTKCTIDFSTLSWKNLNSGTQIKAGVKIGSYKLTTNDQKSANAGTLAETGDFILVRVAGDKTKNVLPSAYSVYEISGNDKTAKVISAAPKSFTAAEKTLMVAIEAGTGSPNTSATAAYLDTNDYSATINSAANTLTLKFAVKVGDDTYEITEAKEIKKATYTIKKNAAASEGLAISEKGVISATENGTYAVTVKYTYNGTELTDSFTIIVSGAGTVVTVGTTVTGDNPANTSIEALSESSNFVYSYYPGMGNLETVKLTPAVKADGKAMTANSTNQLAFTYEVTMANTSTGEYTSTALVSVDSDGKLTVDPAATYSTAYCFKIKVTATWKEGDDTKTLSATIPMKISTVNTPTL